MDWPRCGFGQTGDKLKEYGERSSRPDISVCLPTWPQMMTHGAVCRQTTTTEKPINHITLCQLYEMKICSFSLRPTLGSCRQPRGRSPVTAGSKLVHLSPNLFVHQDIDIGTEQFLVAQIFLIVITFKMCVSYQ